MKTCPVCKQEKPDSDFGKCKDKLQSYCKPCQLIRQRERCARDPKAYYMRKRRWAIKNQEKRDATIRKGKYGISSEEFNTLLAAQNGGCAICGGPPVNRRNLSVDHCHESGRVRGLLCGLCNAGIGLFKDSPLLLQNAIEYLKKYLP